VPVPDLEAGLAFYRDRLGHQPIWRTATQVGLRMPETDAELVLQTERPAMETDLLVASADDAAAAVAAAGGRVVVTPFDIPIGRCAVVADPWGNRLVLLDMRKGPLVTDADGNVVARDHGDHAGRAPPGPAAGAEAPPQDDLAANPWHAHADAFAAWTADRYGAAPEETSPLVAAFLDVLGDLAGREVLDASCGEGLLGRVLARRGARVTGIDVSPRLVEIARTRDPSGAIDYRVADLSRPLPDLAGHFDLVGSHLALNDVADHRGFAATLASLLRPGGRLALAFNNPYSSVMRGHVAGYFDSGALGQPERPAGLPVSAPAGPNRARLSQGCAGSGRPVR
jgi:protein-L-isoaspartate O-methyltransferase